MKPDPHDIELVVTLNPGHPPLSFGQKEPAHATYLDRELWKMEQAGMVRFKKNGGKFKQLEIIPGMFGLDADPCILDLFIVTPPAEWGVLATIRTGPAGFSHWIVTPQEAGGALPPGFAIRDGAARSIEHNLEVVPTPEESDFLDLLGLGWIDPDKRAPQWGRFK